MRCIVLLELPLNAEEECKGDFPTGGCRADNNVAQPLGVLGGAGSGNIAKKVLLVGICELASCFVVYLGEDKAAQVCGVVDESGWEAIVRRWGNRGEYRRVAMCNAGTAWYRC